MAVWRAAALFISNVAAVSAVGNTNPLKQSSLDLPAQQAIVRDASFASTSRRVSAGIDSNGQLHLDMPLDLAQNTRRHQQISRGIADSVSVVAMRETPKATTAGHLEYIMHLPHWVLYVAIPVSLVCVCAAAVAMRIMCANHGTVDRLRDSLHHGHVHRRSPSQISTSSMASSRSASAVIAEAERIRQQYRRLLPVNTAGLAATEACERDYTTLAHTLDLPQLESLLTTKITSSDGYRCLLEAAGLEEPQAAAHLEAFGPNRIAPQQRENPLARLLQLTFGGLFNILLWCCVVVELTLIRVKHAQEKELMAQGPAAQQSKHLDSSADCVTPCILVFVIVSTAMLQWYTEMQAENVMEAVQQMQPNELVRIVRRNRGGERLDTAIDPSGLVPGDVVFLEAGQRVPADLRILYCTQGMEVDNSALTGESLPDTRSANLEVGVSAREARNLVFAGTTVLKGSATGLVFATGDNSFLGKIASGIKGPRTRSTLEIQIEHFVHIIAWVAIGIGLLSVAANLLSRKQRTAAEIVENATTALFAQVPEGLLPTVTLSLMVASRQLSRRNVLVRKLDAVETLGCVSVICSDKTGTLTTGKMSLAALAVPAQADSMVAWESGPPFQRLMPLPGQVTRLETNWPQQSVDGGAPEWHRQEMGWNVKALCACGVLNSAAALVPSMDVPRRPSQLGLLPTSGRDWTESWQVTGSPTEVAILRACADVLGSPACALQLRAEYTKVFEIPFNSDNKWMLTIHRHVDEAPETSHQIILKGAPERVIGFCTVLSNAEKKHIEAEQQALASRGLRVLGVAVRCLAASEVGDVAAFEGSNPENTNFPMDAFSFLGLFGLEDPPKSGVAEAVHAANSAGVKVVMVTGDHPDTARAIAGRLRILPVVGDLEENDEPAAGTEFFRMATESRQPTGLSETGEGPGGHQEYAISRPASEERAFWVLQGTDVDSKMPRGATGFTSDDAPQLLEWWGQVVAHTRVFARVSPIHKQVIVQAYQFLGQGGLGDIVVMTGDGVNDAPALKQAEVGVAMGIRGTEVAKDAADIVLLDDNFESIVNGIEQGRLASDNLQKSVLYTLCSKVPQVVPAFAELVGIPLALNAAQVLLIDIGTDIWTAITYAAQPPEDAMMRRRPRHPRLEKMVNGHTLLYSYCYMGVLQSALCWSAFFMTPGVLDLMRKPSGSFDAADIGTHRQAMTAYYWTLLAGQLAAAISTTTKTQRVFGVGGYGFPNTALNIFLVGELALGLAAVYWPPMHRAFSTAPLPAAQLCIPALVAFGIICGCDEFRKSLVRRRAGHSMGD